MAFNFATEVPLSNKVENAGATSYAGAHAVVFNGTANSADIFPASGAKIYDKTGTDLGANAAFALAAGASVEFWGISTTVWRAK